MTGLTDFDVNSDGLQDLLLVHERNDDGPAGVIPFTGRYVQVLINAGDGSFSDESTTRMGDQSATTPETAQGFAVPRMHDVDRDGCLDLVMANSKSAVRVDAPLVYLNNGRGQFSAMPPGPFTGGDRHFGYFAAPVDTNGDGVVDFVVPSSPQRPRRRVDDRGRLHDAGGAGEHHCGSTDPMRAAPMMPSMRNGIRPAQEEGPTEAGRGAIRAMHTAAQYGEKGCSVTRQHRRRRSAARPDAVAPNPLGRRAGRRHALAGPGLPAPRAGTGVGRRRRARAGQLPAAAAGGGWTRSARSRIGRSASTTSFR